MEAWHDNDWRDCEVLDCTAGQCRVRFFDGEERVTKVPRNG